MVKISSAIRYVTYARSRGPRSHALGASLRRTERIASAEETRGGNTRARARRSPHRTAAPQLDVTAGEIAVMGTMDQPPERFPPFPNASNGVGPKNLPLFEGSAAGTALRYAGMRMHTPRA